LRSARRAAWRIKRLSACGWKPPIYLMVRDGDRIFACERTCPHEQADLSLGRVAGGRLFCPRHLASFDLRNGDVSAGWPSRGLQRYAVRIEDGQIWIDAGLLRSTAS
jgi:3-phenylpropionate/trans-cinnamate dioxygenase ferredoxin component